VGVWVTRDAVRPRSQMVYKALAEYLSGKPSVKDTFKVYSVYFPKNACKGLVGSFIQVEYGFQGGGYRTQGGEGGPIPVCQLGCLFRFFTSRDRLGTGDKAKGWGL
jgi:hypothetical protein